MGSRTDIWAEEGREGGEGAPVAVRDHSHIVALSIITLFLHFLSQGELREMRDVDNQLAASVRRDFGSRVDRSETVDLLMH